MMNPPIKLGQRYLYRASYDPNKWFVGEVTAISSGMATLKIVSHLNWGYDIGHIYLNEDVSSQYFIYLEGQDKSA